MAFDRHRKCAQRGSAPAVHRARGWLVMMAAIVGVLAGLALPFCPVRAQITQLTWPVAGQPVVSSTAILTPYRPRRLLAVIPCSVLRAAAAHAREVMVMSTGTGANSLAVGVTA